MSSIDMSFQMSEPLLSPSQAMVHCEPSLNLSPGAGSLGDTSAWARMAALEASTAVKTMDVNMTKNFRWVYKERRGKSDGRGRRS